MDLTNKIIHGDAIEQIKLFPNNYFDSIVTDPPAGISFMNKKWDDDKGGREHWIKWLSEVFIEAKRTLKPGGHALVWSLPRTSHWTGMALEDAGFEVRDIVHHIFGSGFPKSLDISKQIDKQAGAEREVVGQRQDILVKQAKDLREGKRKIVESLNAGAPERNNGFITVSADVTAPTTPEAKQYSGWGTALKPAVECWWLVRKPISERTVADNVLKWGVGGLNIDGSRVPFESTQDYKNLVDNYKGGLERATPETKENWTLHGGGWKLGKGIEIPEQSEGRFPANLIHDGSEEVLAQFPHSKSGAMTKPYKYTNNGFSLGKPTGETKQIHESNEGSAARFFYCAKPSRVERDAGLEQLSTKEIANNTGNNHFIAPLGRETAYRNNHPTVKAQALMKYLIKLITPPGGIVLDMFAGSGSTCVAADDMGFRYIGIDQELENCKIAEQRLKGKLKGNNSLDAYNNV